MNFAFADLILLDFIPEGAFDLVLLRDTLIHNSVENSKKIICNLMKAKPKFFMTNTYTPYF